MNIKEKFKFYCLEHEKEIKIGLLIAGIIGDACIGYKIYKHLSPKLIVTVNEEIKELVNPVVENKTIDRETIERIVCSNVNPYPRKLQKGHNASAKQIALALENGVNLEPGYTYVTGFERCTHYYS